MYRTGDLGRYRRDGSVEFMGRADQQVQVRGFRVELEEIRRALCRHEAVADAVVVARSGDDGRTELAAYAVPASSEPVTTAELAAFLRTMLPAHMVPARIVPIDTIPLTPNGKLDRRALPEPVDEPVEATSAARDELEETLIELWGEVLNRANVGIHDDFFDLGGYSLLATRLFALLEERTGQRIPVATLFQSPTIAQLADTIRSSGWTTKWTSLVPIKPAGSRPPLFYVTPYLISVLQLAHLGDELGDDQPLYGLEPQGLDGDLPAHQTIEEMATHYIAEMRSVQPHGPYVLGGHCSGAWVAFEMARQLEAEGEEVDTLLLVDQGPPGIERPEVATWRYVVHRLRHFYRDGRLRHALAWQLKIAMNRFLLRRVGSAQVRSTEEVRAAHHRAHRLYEGGVISSDVVLIRSAETLALEDRSWFLHWEAMTTGAMHLDDVIGTHANLLEQPYVIDLADKMRTALDAGQQTGAP
jgi:aspartate racemase